MPEDSSSNEEWCEWEDNVQCWACGKRVPDIDGLMSHCESHNTNATCHICKVPFQHLTSLYPHLDHARSPPVCRQCCHSFSNATELNDHAEARCTGAGLDIVREVNAEQRSDLLSEMNIQERFEMRRPETPDTSENSVEYIVGQDDNNINAGSSHQSDEITDDSSSTTDDDEAWKQPADVCSNDGESDGGSNSSSTDSTDSSDSLPADKVLPAAARRDGICSACRRGPFRSMKLHLRHCTGVRIKHQCSLCRKLFPTEKLLNQHYMLLYSCEVCGQVFSYWSKYFQHQCPKGSDSPVVKFCSESMPKACKICKSFFTTDKSLLNHVTRVHTSVVSTKLCIITKPSALSDKKVLPGVSGTAVRLASSTSGHVLVSSNTINQNTSVFKQVLNGKMSVEEAYGGVLPTAAISSASSESPPAPPVSSGKDAAVGLPPSPSSAAATPASQADSSSAPTIMAMFENDSQELALKKRMNTGWRSKAAYSCRQCGAIFRQPSLSISHRYLHRGHRSHRCHCGRTFKHRLHLLRHCVQHAEAVSYICVSCGETFTGAKLLAEHMTGTARKNTVSSGRTWKHRVRKKCSGPFTCDCGQLFVRPSAYIWHQLKNL